MRPDILANLAYRPFRDMVRAALRHAGGIRIDHILGLFRLWWVPVGLGPRMGTYIRYDHEAMVGILALEAHRAGALVVGEDLGTVEPWVRAYLRERGIMGTSVLWFENGENGNPLPPEQWREYAMIYLPLLGIWLVITLRCVMSWDYSRNLSSTSALRWLVRLPPGSPSCVSVACWWGMTPPKRTSC